VSKNTDGHDPITTREQQQVHTARQVDTTLANLGHVACTENLDVYMTDNPPSVNTHPTPSNYASDDIEKSEEQEGRLRDKRERNREWTRTGAQGARVQCMVVLVFVVRMAKQDVAAHRCVHNPRLHAR
jgi:hypothetical protein